MGEWITACPDWEQRLLSGSSLVPTLPLFRSEAERALRIFKRLQLPDVIDNPTMADACGDWFFPIVEAIFGSYDPETNRRMIQEFFLVIPKGNSKSSNGGAVMVTGLIVNRRPEAEFLLIAPTKEIADIAFKQASGTIKLDPELAKLFHLQRHIRLITHRRTRATLQIKAADTDVITGSKALVTMIDETHVFAKKPRAADVFVELRGALAKRPDGFLFQATTQSKEEPSGVFKSELSIARDVRDGKVTLPILPIIYELPLRLSKDGGWKDRKLWPLVNPNMGRSVNETFLVDELTKAERKGSAALALLASQHFNVEIGLALQSDNWVAAEHWPTAIEKAITLKALIERCEVIVAGIDGGGLDDLLGLAFIGREKATRRWLSWCKAWCFKGVLEIREEIAPKLKDLQAAGELVIIDNLGEDVIEVADLIEEVYTAGLFPEEKGIGVDPVGIGQVVDEVSSRLDDDKAIADKLIIGIPQGWQLTGAIKTCERKLVDNTMVHADQALMTWCVGNAKVEARGNAIIITKQAAGKAKIDPLMALFNAVALMSKNPEAGGGSYLDDEDLITL